MASLFGGSKKVNTLTGGQYKLLDNLSGTLNKQLGRSGPVYGGQITPGANENQQAAFGAAGGLLSGQMDLTPQISSMLQGGSAHGLDPQAYAQQAIVDPATLAYKDAQRDLEARYGGTWGQTGGFQDIMQENAARFGTGLSQTLAEFARYNQDAGNQQQQAGIQAAFGNTQNQSNALNTLLGIGAEERAQEAQRNLEAYNQWNAGQAYNNPWLGLLGPTLGTQAFGVGQEQGLIPQIGGALSQFSSASKPL